MMNIVDLLIFSLIGTVFVCIGAFFGAKIRSNQGAVGRFSWQNRKLEPKHILATIAIGSLVAFAISSLFLMGNTAFKTGDTEIINGEVVRKEQEKVSCSHSYSCNCKQVTSCSGSGKNRSCSTSTVCETCYEHSNDWDWNLITNIGTIEIDRIDRQGKHMPPRWGTAKPGDPVAMTHWYKNYVKAVPESLFNANDNSLIAKFSSQIPVYPLGIYDYHHIDRVLSIGVPVPDLKQYNMRLSNMLKELGPTKQANIVVVFVKNADPNYTNALKASWLGGKKNDIVVVIGSTEFPNIDWVGVIAWSKNELFKVELRDAIYDLKEINQDKVMSTIHATVKRGYVRQSFKEYEYLEDDIHISEDAIFMLMIIQFLLGIGPAVLVVKFEY